MVYQIDIHQEAEEEFDQAITYFNEIEYGLGHRFIEATELIYQRLMSNPFQFPISQAGIRKAVLKKFPYSILFTIEIDRVFIIAIFHQKKKPRNWLKRLKDSFS